MSQAVKGVRATDAAHNQVPSTGSDELGAPPKPRKPFRTRSVSIGGCLIGSLDDISQVLAIAEGEDDK
jgi:hypothetical protein